MSSWLGQYCINVQDLDKAVGVYEALGLTCTSRTEIPDAWEAIVENPDGGSKLQLAQQKEKPFALGNALWKLYVNTRNMDETFLRATEAGCSVVSDPVRMDRWPVTVGFVNDPDGYLVEFVERHPWSDDDPATGPWLGQYCLNVTDIDRTIQFYEQLGLTCTSRTEIPTAFEAIIENPGQGSKLQLAQQNELGGALEMGSMWKLYVNTDDCTALHERITAAGHTSMMAPMRLEQWPVTIAFVADPDGYQVELVQRDPD